MKWFTIGSLTLPASHLALILAFIAGGVFARLRYGKECADIYSNAVFLFIAVWKLSVVLFSFSLVLQAPMSLIYFNGGVKGVWLALLMNLLYSGWKWPREQMTALIFTWMVVVIAKEAALPILNGEFTLMLVIQLAGSLVFVTKWLNSLFNQSNRLILFTLWQIFFYSWNGQLFSMTVLAYSIVAIFWIWNERRESVG
ncbi:hypothetical protein JOC78_001728 [Bacillus ectoiniformans]|uniref:hypothetical protein n=1 Tax=Bacillus ectoiniformans TaxID=1494429 RepID=UPI00195F114B|nr:hypothetical protein [Bacillus ectoiniformans]MBM7648782.1 hypothetical protein [Bacillus ectoiniformans]